MSGRLQREIEEILSRYDSSTPRGRRWRRRLRGLQQRLAHAWEALRFRLRRLSLGQLMLLGIFLLLVAFFFRSTTPFTVYAGLGLFFGAFLLSFRRSHTRTAVLWRGHPVDLSHPGFSDKLRRWWRERRRYRHR